MIIEQVMSDFWYIEDRTAWFISTWNCFLYKMNLNTRKIDCVGIIPDERNSMHLYVNCLKYCNFIFCFPDLGKHIYRFDLRNQQWERLCENYFMEKRAGVKALTINKNIVILFSKGLNALLWFDLIKGKILKRFTINTDEAEIGQAIYHQNRVFITDRKRPIVYVYDLTNDTISDRLISDSQCGFNTIVSVRNDILLTGNEKYIYKWDTYENRISRYELSDDIGEYVVQGNQRGKIIYDIEKFVNPIFISSISAGNKVYFVPFITNKLVCLEEEYISYINMIDEEENKDTLSRDCAVKFTELAVTVNNRIVLCSYKNSQYETICVDNDEFNLLKCELSGNICRQLSENGELLHESKGFKLDDYIKIVM